MVCFDDEELADRRLLLRRWGRRSEVQLFGSQEGRRRPLLQSPIDDGLEYDNLFIFDEVGWNFEPSELSAAFGLVQLDKLADNLARRQRNFALHQRALRASGPTCSSSPALTDGVETGWHMFPVLIRPGVGHPPLASSSSTWRRSGVDTRMVWTGNVTAPARVPGHRRTGCPPAGCPNADRVMEQGLILPNNHSPDRRRLRLHLRDRGSVPAAIRPGE